jgi:DNA-binding MarR family transcriptional regulator
MEKLKKVLNELLVKVFNDILTIEQTVLKNGTYSDLSVTEMHTIEAIGMYSRTMSGVAENLKITVGTLTIAINRLVKKGYVERKRVPEDRRIVQIQLTKKGEAAYLTHKKFHEDMIDAMIQGFNIDDEKILLQALQQLNQFFNMQYQLERSKKKE